MTTTNDSCVLAEPIAALLSTIYMCLHKLKSILSEDEIEEILDNDVVEQIHGIFKSLSQRMCKCELEDFNLERNVDFSSNTKVGQKNNITASLVLSIYNTLIEYNSNAKALTYEKAELMLSLHGSIKRLNDFMQATKSMELSGKSFVEKQLQSISFVQLSNLVY
uniref:FANCI helical domain-containing protein n=1 Tax=Ciona savignyi TaxID=51511 RepID=H2ZJ96_CIOSA